MQNAKICGKRVHFIRRVAKSGPVYLVTIPPDIGKLLHRKLVLVTIEVVEEGLLPKGGGG